MAHFLIFNLGFKNSTSLEHFGFGAPTLTNFLKNTGYLGDIIIKIGSSSEKGVFRLIEYKIGGGSFVRK